MIRETTLWGLVDRRAEMSPDALFALDEAGTSMSFSEYRNASLRLAAGLAARGVHRGSTVSWILPTGFPALLLMAALSRLGAVQVPIIPIYRRREVEFCLRQTRAELLIVPRVFRGFDYASLAEDLARDGAVANLIVLDAELPEGDPGSLPDEFAHDEADAVRWIYYTSGTTSDPKGVRHTDGSVMQPSYGLAAAMDLRPEDRIAFVFPVTHLGGANSLVAALSTGCSHLLVERFDPPSTLDFLAASGVTHAGAGPVFHKAYLEAQRASGSGTLFPEIRVFQGGGAQKDPKLHFDLKNEIGGMGILSVYGMTECPIVSLGRSGEPDEKLAYTEGRVNLDETVVHVVRSDGTTAGAGEEGELRIRSPQLMKGYVDAALDRDAFDQEGFFKTGDLGSIDADGHLIISGRIKDLIIRKGENISAAEVENLLLGHPKVRDVAVIGLPDPETGERCCAVVVSREPEESLEFEEMVTFLREAELMIQKIPEQLEIVGELPRNPSGKILKREIRERFAATPELNTDG